MSHSAPIHDTLDDWIARDAIPFSVDSPETFHANMKNLSYIALTPQSFTDFDWLAVLNSSAYSRGAPPLQEWDAGPEQ